MDINVNEVNTRKFSPERLPLALRGFFLPMGQNLQKISRNIG